MGDGETVKIRFNIISMDLFQSIPYSISFPLSLALMFSSQDGPKMRLLSAAEENFCPMARDMYPAGAPFLFSPACCLGVQ